MGHSPEMSSTPKKNQNKKTFCAIYLLQIVQCVVCMCSSYLALSEHVTYIALIFLSLLRS